MLELPSWIESLSAVWGAIVGASGGVAGILGWRWWGRKKQSGESSATAVELSVVRAVAGPGARELGTILADRVKFWRLTNLIRISEKVDRIRKEKKLRPADIRPLTFAVGLPLLEHAANVEEDELQEIWANLMVSALTDSGSPEDHGDDLYRTWASILAEMSSWDCRLLSTVIEEGIAENSNEGIRTKPLTHDKVRAAADMPTRRVDMHLEKLVSLGLVYRDVKSPIQSGGPTGIEYVFAPTLMGIDMYTACGNTPRWAEQGSPDE